MAFGEIIKRAWHITWRYRALWVLGLFAGITGGSFGGGSNYSSSSRSSGGNSPDQILRGLNSASLAEYASRFLPAIIAVVLLLVAFGFVLWILGIAARGGLIHAVDAIEGGHPFTLREAWDAGFGHFWRLLGAAVLLGLPVALVALGLAAAVAVTVIGTLRLGAQSGLATFAPMCGAFVIGLPLLVVGGVILGTMSLLAMRSIVLEDARVFQAAGGAWRTFRSRIKDNLIMWLITLGLNAVSSLVVAIPLVVVIVATAIPAVFLVRSQSWPALIGVSAIAVLVFSLVLMLYTAIWGTFTSALWTIFYRRLTGREIPAAPEGTTL